MGSEKAAALDLRSAEEDFVLEGEGSRKLVSTGISIDLIEGYAAFVLPRSGLANKHGLTVANSPGLIDNDYHGIIKVILINHGKESILISKFDRIAQLMLVEYTQVEVFKGNIEERKNTERGINGFGSTGSN